MMIRRPSFPSPASLSRFAAGLLCALAVLLLVPSTAAATGGALRCETTSFAVNLSPSDSQIYHVFGVLCARGGLAHKTIQVALHGSTYSHLYWDFPFQPAIYSYVRWATASGYAVLSIDRIGIGQSDHPPADQVTVESNAYVVHQIVQTLRNGELVLPTFGTVHAERVALVGHSLGSLISVQEAGTYGDVDGVVLTGMSHTVVTAALGEVQFYPANLDPHFAGRNIPDDYFTTVPGTRSIFYHAPFYDSRVLATDERTKETTTLAALNTGLSALSFSTGIHVPVLVVVGNFDGAFCAAPNCAASGSLKGEPAFYPADACAEAVAIPGSGHVLNLHYTAPLTYATVLGWLDRRLGNDTRVPARGCRP
jgi:pimeloyl-ACP methyl ester carboxylesterase